MSEEQNQPKKPINLGGPVVESGPPELAPRAGGFATGPRGSKYDPVLDAAQKLEVGKGFVRVSIEEGTDADAAINALRATIKRRTQDKSLKVRRLADGDLAIFRA